MHIKSILIVLMIGAVYIHESEAVPKPLGLIKAKIAVAKTKLAIAKAPHIIATAIVAKEVKTKTKIAAAKALAAAKAAKVAAVSAITAPIRIAKTKFAIKLAAFKAFKALKLAKIASAVAILKNLKKSPIILPVPVALPIGKQLPSLPSLPSLPNIFGSPAATTTPAPATESSNPLLGLLQAAGAGAIFSALTKPAKEVQEVVTPAPVYRFLPEVGFTNYNKVSYQPRLEIEVPAPISYAAYPVGRLTSIVPATPVIPATPIIPAETYGPPAEVYGLPPN